MKKKQRLIYSVLSIVVLAGFAALVLFSVQAASGQPAGQAVTPPPGGQVEQLRAALQADGLSEPARRGLQEKLSMAERMAGQQAAAAHLPRREKVAPPLPAAAMQLEPSPVYEEIFEGSEGLVKPSQMDVQNGWQGERDGALLQVFAGSLPGEAGQGVVMVVRVGPGEAKRSVEWFRPPGEPGALKITEARESLLVLAGADGSRLELDLETMTFR